MVEWLQREIHFSLSFFLIVTGLLLSCDFAATFLLLSRDLAATFLLLSCELAAWLPC